MTVVPYNDGQWRRFFAIAGKPQMIDDPRYRTILDRSRHFSELYRFIEETLATRTNAEWTIAFSAAELPFAPTNSFEDLLHDPHLEAIGFWRIYDHPTEGRLRMPGLPVKFSDTPCSVRRDPPNLGEHTEEVLREIGM
jgi:crotonobetainyl-CoA:carnitine CoA-transferase CaiB-like acyl-CoA transferase